MTVQERLLDSAERRAEEGRKRLEEVEREWEEDLERRRDGEKRIEEERRDWELARSEYETKVVELRETVETLVEANSASGVASNGRSGFEGGAVGSILSPTAGLANTLMKKKGQSLSDLYVENVRVKGELSRSQLETSRVQELLSEILRDIQEKVSTQLGFLVFPLGLFYVSFSVPFFLFTSLTQPSSSASVTFFLLGSCPQSP